MEAIHWSIVLLILWVLLPLVPSILLYKVFPNTTVAASGPFAGLTIAAGGAFAGYLIVLLALPLLVRLAGDQLRDQLRGDEIWTVQARVHQPGPRGPVPVRNQPLRVTTTDPDWYRVIPGGTIVAYVRTTPDGQFPMLEVDTPDGRAQTIDLDDGGLKKVIDRKRKIIRVTEPVVLEQPQPYEGTSIGPAG